MENVTVFNTLSAPYAIIFHIAMFFVLNEYRYPRKKAALLTALFNMPILVLTIIIYLLLGSEKGGQLAILFYIIPQMAVSLFLSRYRDGRAFSTYFFVSGINIFIIQISNLIDHYTSSDNHIVMFLVRFIAYPVALFILWRSLSGPYRRAMNVVHAGWSLFAYISAMHTLILLAVFNFPTTLSKRPYDIPVLVMVFGVMLLTNAYYIQTLLGQHDYYVEREMNHYLEQQMEIMQQKVKLSAESEKNISIYRHDLRHILTTLGGMLSEGSYDEAKDFIEKHTVAVEQDMYTKWCTDPVLNAMFSAYFADAEKQGIQIDADIDIPDLSDDDATAFSLVLANAIENAIHAVSKLPAEDRLIRVRAVRSPQMMFSVSNPYEGSITLNDEGIPTSGDTGHGIGISSMLSYCEKHNAVCDFKINDGWFAVRIVKG